MLTLHHSSFVSSIEESTKRKSSRWRILLVIALLGIGTSFVFSYLNTPPTSFSAPTEVVIESGVGVTGIATTLVEAEVIRSAWWFKLQTVLFYDPTAFQAGVYEFKEPQTIGNVITKLQQGEAVVQDISVTLVEGRTRDEYAVVLAAALPNFDPEEFLTLSSELEGYLFPDTYRFAPKTTATTALNVLTTTFAERTKSLEEVIATHSLTKNEVVNLASILEKEANSPESMKLVSGILQNRLQIGMALQADATVGYVLDKPLSELTPEDLKRESRYNTYLHPGLPPTPISNPGLTALEAVLHPTPSEYLYYITGNDGKFYYSETYAEHQRNIDRYLR